MPDLAGGLLPNLVGRAMGGLISGALSSLTKQLQEAAKEQQGVYEEAAERIRVRERVWEWWRVWVGLRDRDRGTGRGVTRTW